MIIQTITLNMIPDGAPQVIHINQNDTGEDRFQIYLNYNGNPYVWSNSATFKLRGTKPDMQTFEVSCSTSGTDYLICDLTDDMDDVAGDVFCNIEMTDGDERVGTQAFILRVQQEAK
jgi:hypothetical protein